MERFSTMMPLSLPHLSAYCCRVILLSMATLGAVEMPGLAYVAEHWVSPSGSDANSRSRGSPLRTTQKGADAARVGDIVTFMPGEYGETLVPVRKSGTQNQPIVVGAQHPATDSPPSDWTTLTSRVHKRSLLVNNKNHIVIEEFATRNTAEPTLQNPVVWDGNGGPPLLEPDFSRSARFRLRPGSPAIYAEVDFGLPHDGSAPDIGSNEFIDTQPGSDAACHLLTASHQVPAGFGAPYDAFSQARQVLLNATCTDTRAGVEVGTGSNLLFIFEQGYELHGGQWQPFTYEGSERIGPWIIGRARATLARSAREMLQDNFFVAYVCQWRGQQIGWKCGCRDASCIQSFWQLQAFRR